MAEKDSQERDGVQMRNAKSGLEVCVLAIPKNASAIEETEGILSHLEHELQEKNLEPIDLVKRAWKSSEHEFRSCGR